MENQTGLVTFIIIASLFVFSLIVIIILFFVINQRKILLKNSEFKLMENEKQLAFSLR